MSSPGPFKRNALTVAAIGDLHLGGTATDEAVVRRVIEGGSGADVLAVCGDLTSHGRLEEARAFAQAIKDFEGTVVAVLGNHDPHSSGLRPTGNPVLGSERP